MKRLRSNGGFTLIELLIVIIIIGILAAIAIPMFLNQRDKAHDSAVKEGVHSIQIGVQTFAVDKSDVFPTVGEMTGTSAAPPTALASFVDNWPRKQWPATAADKYMKYVSANASGANKGDYTYTGGGTANFILTGWGKDATTGVLVVP